MRILMTFNVPYTRIHGGANRSNKALAETLAARGHDVFAVSPALPTPTSLTYAQWRDELLADGVPIESGQHEDTFDLAAVHVTAVREARDVRACLVAKIQDIAPDWVLVSSEDPSQTLLAAALDTLPGRVAYMALTPQLFPFGPESLYPGAERADLVRQAELVFCLSTAAADYLREHAGVDAQIYAPPHFGPGPFPRVGNLDGSVLLMNACDVKGLPIFLDMARSAPDRRFAALPGYGTTSANRAALDSLDNVEIWENTPDLDEIFARTSVLAVPSLWMESFGLAVVDAMLRGVPVLAADHGALPEAKLGTEYLLPVWPISGFRDDLDENYLLAPIVPEQDAAPWCAALSELLADERTYSRHAEHAWRAANDFARGLSVAPFERMLLEHRPRAGVVPPSRAARPAEQEQSLAPADRSDLIEQLRSRRRHAAGAQQLDRVDRAGPILASAQQHQLWLLRQLFPSSSAYNCANSLLVRGELDVPTLRRALRALVVRHEALRTTFAARDGELFQVIGEERDVALNVTVLSESAQFDGETLDDWMRREAARPFDLATGPLMRCALRRTGADEHILMMTLHHIVCDGWSAGILVRDLGTLYAAFADGRRSPLPALERDGADYTAWQRAQLSDERRAVLLKQWRSRLSSAPPTLDLPVDRPRTASAAHRGQEIEFAVPAAHVAALRNVGIAHDATLFMTLSTAFAAVLSRLSGETDIVVGTPVAGRRHPRAEGMVGFFVNTVVLRIDANGDPTFDELLDRVRDTTLDALTYQDLPFERLVEELAPDRSLGHSPIFQVMIAFENTPAGQVSLAGLEIEHRPVTNGAAKFDLNLELAQAGDRIEGILEYDSDLFDGRTAQTIVDCLLSLVADAGARPGSRLGELAILEPAGELAVRELLSVKAPAQWLQGSVVDLFAEQVRRVPEALAIASGATRWTYRELDGRSDELAATLVALGVGPGRNAAVCLSRGSEYVLAVLAVLKTGAAYVPLDPEQPEAHLRRIVADATPQVLLTVDGLGPDLADAVPSRLHIDAAVRPSSPSERSRDSSLERPIHPDDVVYVMYTSGSTGRPKGVALTHRAVAHLVRWHQAKFPGPARTMQFAAVGFDVSFYEVFTTLCSGGSLHVVPEADKRDLRRLPGFLREHRIEKAELPAVLLPLLAEQWLVEAGDELEVRDISCTGEQLKLTAAVREFVHRHPRLALHNDYGPTETHIVTSSVLSAREDLGGPLPPIGVPVTGSRLYVLDRHGRLAPPGIPGELFLAGACLARGYHAAPTLTAQRFVPDPYAPQPGQRMYRTGDRARLRADGELEYLGRLDDQVKVRGMRVEPAGVEVLLRRMGGLSNAAVMSRRGTDGTQELVAYVVADELPGPTVSAIRQYLSDELPRYMVPSEIVALDHLPLTPNGKVDRSALPEPAQLRRQTPAQRIRPRTDLERRLVTIWERVLDREGIGVRDSFFDLGGYSLRMLQVATRVHETWGVEIPMESFFSEPTIEHMAIVVTELLSARVDESFDDLLDRIEQMDGGEATAAAEAHRSPHIVGAAAPSQARDCGAAISALGFPSSNRPRDLDACARSYLTNAREHDRRLDAVVCSDPRDDPADRTYRELLASVQRDLGTPVWYAGPAEKRAFIAALAAEGVSPEVAGFALLPSGDGTRAYGTNRNSLLLHNVGSLFLSVDDDTRADLGLPIAHAEGVRFRADAGVSEIRVLDDRIQSAAFIASADLDLVGLHTGLLGAAVDEVIARGCLAGRPSATPGLGAGHVVGTYHGWVGDSGWASTREGLFLSGDSWTWLTRTETAYQAAMRSREQVRYVDQLTLFRGPEFYIVAAGLDGREVLPPFLPVHRRGDYWFGQLVHTILPEAVMAHLPTTVTHGDGASRSYPEPDGVDIAMVLAACVERFDAPVDATTGPRRMEALGRYLVELGGLPVDEQNDLIGAAVAAHLESDIAELEERVATCPVDRAFWARDMRGILELNRLRKHREWFVPASLAQGGDGRAELRTLLARVGGLLAEWPSLLGAAAALRDRGVRLAQPIAGAGRAR